MFGPGVETRPAPVALQRVGRALVVPIDERLDEPGWRRLETLVLEQVAAESIEAVVFDLGAVTVLDAVQTAALRALTRALRWLGARVALAAVRPGVAACLAALGFAAEGCSPVRTVDEALGTAR